METTIAPFVALAFILSVLAVVVVGIGTYVRFTIRTLRPGMAAAVIRARASVRRLLADLVA